MVYVFLSNSKPHVDSESEFSDSRKPVKVTYAPVNVNRASELPAAQAELTEIRLPYRDSPRPALQVADVVALPNSSSTIWSIYSLRSKRSIGNRHAARPAGVVASPRREALCQPSISRSDKTGAAEELLAAVPLELSIVMPCLDEADTVGTCVLKALYAIEKWESPEKSS